ncbi:putative tetraacyldisaccharide 4'-kinase, mitochondrial [Sesamum angolense]|uniref:tetraacyldisaccharide 4'-kinase n=1 Tax=Sesamum angolense TaxID=2727404 RepID=A0AAE1W548_9LAMI|nr:putative tetraacyldisaccharide 4'-kinase, mitochondrial [Sesamum angolense]
MEKVRRAVKQIACTPPSKRLSALSAFQLSLIPLLSIVSSLYSVAIRLRRHLYRFNLLQKHRLPVPVISVGNLTWGGNGKTPMVQFLARCFADDGISPLILTRGYGGADEAKMLQRQLQGTSVKIGVGANRVAIAARFLEQYGYVTSLGAPQKQLSEAKTDILYKLDMIGVAILDDGMQMGAAYVDHLDFSDHHLFQLKDIEVVRTRLQELESEYGAKPICVVTEKDYDRAPEVLEHLKPYEVLVLCSRLAHKESTEDSFKKIMWEHLRHRLIGPALCEHGVSLLIQRSTIRLGMEASFVSRARTAINSAAAKAEKVFTDIKKSDSIAHRDLDKQSPSASTPESSEGADESKDYHEAKSKGVRPRPSPIKTKRDWHERFRNIRIGKRGPEDSRKSDNSTMAYAIFDDNLYLKGNKEVSDKNDSEDQVTMESSKAMNTDIIPSSAIVKQLAVAIEAAVNYNSMKDLLVSSRGSSPIREKASLGISAMKSLVLREKEDKLASEFGGDEKVLSVMNTLLNAEGQFTGRTLYGLEAQINATSLLKDIHGAPVESFVVGLSEAVGCLKTLRKMASFWSRVVAELRRLWYEGLYIPGIPTDDIPDLNSCLLYQQLQVINCCISRKRRHTAAIESLESIESVTFQASPNAEDYSASDGILPEGRVSMLEPSLEKLFFD